MLTTVYLICFLTGVLLALARAALSMFGGEMHGDFHGDMDHPDGAAEAGGLGLFNLTVISTFVTVFGGVGVLSVTQFHMGDAASLLTSTLTSLVASFGVYLGLRAILRQTQAGSEVQSVLGLRAEVVTPIPVDGMGEIAYVAKGTRYVSPAREKSGRAVGRGSVVTISDMAGAVCVVVVEE